jgi:hypothetical protein
MGHWWRLVARAARELVTNEQAWTKRHLLAPTAITSIQGTSARVRSPGISLESRRDTSLQATRQRSRSPYASRLTWAYVAGSPPAAVTVTSTVGPAEAASLDHKPGSVPTRPQA